MWLLHAVFPSSPALELVKLSQIWRETGKFGRAGSSGETEACFELWEGAGPKWYLAAGLGDGNESFGVVMSCS